MRPRLTIWPPSQVRPSAPTRVAVPSRLELVRSHMTSDILQHIPEKAYSVLYMLNTITYEILTRYKCYAVHLGSRENLLPVNQNRQPKRGSYLLRTCRATLYEATEPSRKKKRTGYAQVLPHRGRSANHPPAIQRVSSKRRLCGEILNGDPRGKQGINGPAEYILPLVSGHVGENELRTNYFYCYGVCVGVIRDVPYCSTSGGENLQGTLYSM